MAIIASAVTHVCQKKRKSFTLLSQILPLDFSQKDQPRQEFELTAASSTSRSRSVEVLWSCT